MLALVGQYLQGAEACRFGQGGQNGKGHIGRFRLCGYTHIARGRDAGVDVDQIAR
jgi:hypothetical protein